jgi:LCP family protein required for cell wall assembly
MLSIPRDLWVTIPGFEPNRINTAYRNGEIYQYPGGGPALAMKTVEELLGLKIDYFAQVDFGAFVRFIDEIGGVKIDVPEKITVDLIGGGRETKKKLEPGVQVLPGEWALAYARARNSEGGDFDRAERQQQIIFGIRDRILSQDLLPILVSKSPILYEELSKGVNTNLSLEEAIKLAWLAAQIPEENIKRGVIGPPEYVRFGVSPDGDEVVRPVPAMIRQLRDEVFAASVPISPVAANAEPKELMQAENARLSLLNGANIPGLAARTQEYLNQEGVNVVETSDAPEPSFTTTIIDYTGNPYTLTYLVKLMNISENNIRSRFDPSSPVDVALILGSDWANNNPLP